MEHASLSKPDKEHFDATRNLYLQSSKPPKKSSPMRVSKSRSLGLLDDIHDYITGVEAMAEGHKTELDRIKEEKLQIEKVFTVQLPFTLVDHIFYFIGQH